MLYCMVPVICMVLTRMVMYSANSFVDARSHEGEAVAKPSKHSGPHAFSPCGSLRGNELYSPKIVRTSYLINQIDNSVLKFSSAAEITLAFAA